MPEPTLDAAIDLALERLQQAGGDPRGLPAPLRTVALVASAQGVIDNGGLRYFLENDWPGQPPYGLFVEAYRAIGATAEAQAIGAACEAVGREQPERQREARLAFLAQAGSAERLAAWEASMVSDVWALLGEYVQHHQAAFSGELEQEDRP